MQATFAYRPTECVFPHSAPAASGGAEGAITVRATMPGAANSPCITYVGRNTTMRYYTSRICITGPIVSGGDGELTVFHTCTTSGANIPAAISVFALRTQPAGGPDRPIDRIIAAAAGRAGWTELDLGPYADSASLTNRGMHATLADGKPCVVWLHSKEIDVAATFAEFSADTAEIYKLRPSRSQVPCNGPIVEGYAGENSAASTDDIYECEYLPVDSNETVQTYEIPINSKFVSQAKISASAEIISMLTMITVVFVFSFFAAPMLYPTLRSLVFKDANNDAVGKTELNTQTYHIFSRLLMPHIFNKDATKLLNITVLGTWITIVWMIGSLVLLIYGGATNDLSVILGGIYALIIITVSVISNTFFSVLHANKP
jgi:hypothetical protein